MVSSLEAVAAAVAVPAEEKMLFQGLVNIDDVDGGVKRELEIGEKEEEE